MEADESTLPDPLRNYHDFNHYFGAYFSLGFKCIFAHEGMTINPGQENEQNLQYCGYGYLWIISYVFSLFVLQACLTTVRSINCLILIVDDSQEAAQCEDNIFYDGSTVCGRILRRNLYHRPGNYFVNLQYYCLGYRKKLFGIKSH